VDLSGTYAVDPVKKTLTISVESSSAPEVVATGTITQQIWIDDDWNTFRASGAGSTGEFTRK